MNKDELSAKIAKLKANTLIPEGLKTIQLKKLEKQLADMETPAVEFSTQTSKNRQEWEREIADKLISKLKISNGDAQGIMEARQSDIDGYWLKNLDAATAARELIAPSKKTSKKSPKKNEKHIYKGKELKGLTEENCKELLAEVAERRIASKKAAKKSRTKPVIEKIAANVVKAATAAIKEIPVQDIKDNPKKELNKMDKAITIVRNCVKDLKALFGSDLESGNIADEFKPLVALVKELKDKYGE